MLRTDELAAAVERLRRDKAGEQVYDAYDDLCQYPDGDGEGTRWEVDCAIVANAYLARESEQPAIPNHKSGMPLPMTPATWRSLLLNLRHRSDPEAWAICQLCCYLLDRETNGGE